MALHLSEDAALTMFGVASSNNIPAVNGVRFASGH
jgi:hypothetical protein